MIAAAEADLLPPGTPGADPWWFPAPLRRILRIAAKSALVVAAVGTAVGLLYFCLSFRYDLDAIHRMPERSVVFDRDGQELVTLHGENRRLITREEIPAFFVQALMAREDKRFTTHHGVDLRGLARAFLRNAHDRSFTQGASTLTMQLARNSIDLGENDLHRKAIEMAVAVRMDARFTKDEILTAYVNRIYFGAGCHGLEEAALRYFRCSASALNDNQCALLAGIIRAPHAFSPSRNLGGALTQRDEVLARLVDEERITPARADAIKAQALGLAENGRPSPGNTATRAIRRHFEAILAAREIRQGGLHLVSTLDASRQSKLQAELAEVLETLDPEVQVAAVSLDPSTGAVRAIVGGRASRPTNFNRAFDARRDLGPLIGPFLFAAAAERGAELHPGEPLRTGRQLGEGDCSRLLKRLGFRGPFGTGDDLYRGTLAATPLEVATAAATLANHGQRPRTFLLEEIRDPDNRLLFAGHPSITPALAPEAADAGLEAFFTAAVNIGPQPLILTGHSLSRNDAWGLSFGARDTTCIWLGHDQPRPLASPDRATRLLHKALTALAD